VANSFFDKGLEGFATAGVNWTADTIKVVLVDAADYTVSLTTHDFLDDVPALARVGTAVALTSPTATAGVLDAADATLTAVTGDVSEYVLIYKDTGVEATSRLIALIDTATGLPVTPNGGSITVQWDNGANKIGRI